MLFLMFIGIWLQNWNQKVWLVFYEAKKVFYIENNLHGYYYFFLNVHKFRQEMKVNQVLKKV